MRGTILPALMVLIGIALIVRTLVATVDGVAWETSVWREKSGRTLLPVPRRVRGTKGHGDTVQVKIEFDAL